jgi:glycosyltransferase involved in cell wall biosynthesis
MRHIAVIGHIADDCFFGGERSLLDILAAVDRSRYQVSCVLPGTSEKYARAVEKLTDNITAFPYHWWSKAQPFDEQTVSRFETIFRKNGVDLVHVNTITLMDPLLAARRLEIPGILHARELVNQDEGLAEILGEDPAVIVSKVLETADFIIANSDATHRLYHKGGRSFRLYNSVDINHFDLPNELEPGRLKVGIISNSLPRKGIDAFVNLARLARTRRPGLEFVVIGPRTEHTDTLEQAARAEDPPPNLHFAGYAADPVDAMQQINVVVSFSIVAESFGRSIAEAMAARRPVIAYAWGAAPELVRHGRDGFLVPYLDYEKALDYLGELTDHPERVLEMGQNGRERAEQLFSSKVFAEQLNGIYRQVVHAWEQQGSESRVMPR